MALVGPELWIDGGDISQGYGGAWPSINRERLFAVGANDSNVSELSSTLLTEYAENVRRAIMPTQEERQQRFLSEHHVPAMPIVVDSPTGFISVLGNFKRTLQRAVLQCCLAQESVDSWDREIQMDKAVRREMIVIDQIGDDTTIEEHVVSYVHDANAEMVHHVPKLVANVVVALCAKLGLQAMDRAMPGNVVLVRAEAARMMRDWNVRTKDAAAHLHLVEKYFFGDNTHYHISSWRARHSRKSRFVRWVLGEKNDCSFDF